MSIDSKWLKPMNNPNKVSKNLFCFHHVGGSASFFRNWLPHLPDHIKLFALQLPGREERYNESFVTDIQVVLDKLFNEIDTQLADIPYLFFGHSMGGGICYELAAYLQSKSKPLPDCITISAKNPPCKQKNLAVTNKMSDQQFIENLTKYNGTPPAVLADQDLIKFLLPRLRADTLLLESNTNHSQKTILDCPIKIFSGLNDEHANQQSMLTWEKYTTKPIHQTAFPGDHFFINQNLTHIMKTLFN